jgi:hypothetical protein
LLVVDGLADDEAGAGTHSAAYYAAYYTVPLVNDSASRGTGAAADYGAFGLRTPFSVLGYGGAYTSGEQEKKAEQITKIFHGENVFDD